MDHLAAGRSKEPTGHGRERSGAVPVIDLVNDPSDGKRDELRGSDLQADEACGEGLIPTRVSTLLTIAALCLLLLCGTTAAITAITAHSPPSSGASPRPGPVAGAWTFRPDLLHGTRWPFTPEPGPRETPGPGAPEPAPEGPKVPPSGEIGAPEHIVAFYSLLETDPERAVDMLSPELLGDQRDEIVRAWREIASVRVPRMQPGPDGSVLAEVAVEYPDGSRITFRHELAIAQGPQIASEQVAGNRHIVGARLRTAHLVPAG